VQQTRTVPKYRIVLDTLLQQLRDIVLYENRRLFMGSRIPQNQGCKFPALQIAVGIKFLRCGTCSVSPFWHLQFWGGCCGPGKLLQLCH